MMSFFVLYAYGWSCFLIFVLALGRAESFKETVTVNVNDELGIKSYLI